MINRMPQLPDEDDEAFLMRAERVMRLEEPLVQDHARSLVMFDESFVQDQARSLVAAALDLFDKAEGPAGGIETLRSLLVVFAEEPGDEFKDVVEELDAANRRSLLTARAMLRTQQGMATGADPIAGSAYALVNRLAIEVLRDGDHAPS